MHASDATGRRAYLVERYVRGITWGEVVDAAERTDRQVAALRNDGANLVADFRA
jgi:hypothetical protein